MEEFSRYLGDGVYATFDGYHIVLSIKAGLNYSRQEIFLDGDVLLAFDEFRKELERLYGKEV